LLLLVLMLASLLLLTLMLLLAYLPCLASFVPHVLTVAVLTAIASVLADAGIPDLLLLILLLIAF
jgi:hypothetical protein